MFSFPPSSFFFSFSCSIYILHYQIPTTKYKLVTLQTGGDRRILAVKIRNARSQPQSLIKTILHIVGNKRRPAKWTSLLIMIHPTVQTAPVEYMSAICEPSDLIIPIKFVQTNGTALRRVNQFGELNHRQQLPDQRC